MDVDTEAEERLRRNPETMAMLARAEDSLRRGEVEVLPVLTNR